MSVEIHFPLKSNTIAFKSIPPTHQTGQSVQAESDLSNVALLEQVGGLEDLLLWHAVLLNSRLEALNVLHQLEVGSLLLDLLHGSGRDGVDQLAEDDAVLQHLIVFADQLLASDGRDPIQNLLLSVLVAGLKLEQRDESVVVGVKVKMGTEERGAECRLSICISSNGRRISCQRIYLLQLLRYYLKILSSYSNGL